MIQNGDCNNCYYYGNESNTNTLCEGGIFVFVSDPSERSMLVTASKAVSELGLVEWLRDFGNDDDALFEHPNMERIYWQIELLDGEIKHSGATFTFTMQAIQFVLRNGLEAYKARKSIKSAKFDFIKKSSERIMIETAYKAVSDLGLMDWLANGDAGVDGITFFGHPNMTKIYERIATVYTGHSGTSFVFTMRTIQFIARNGLDAYKATRL